MNSICTHKRKAPPLMLALFGAAIIAWSASADQIVPAIGSADGEEIAHLQDPDDPNVIIGLYEAAGTGTVIGEHVTYGITRFNLLTGEISGEFYSESVEFPGTSIRGRYTAMSGILIPSTFTIFRTTLNVEWFDGTGRLQGATGSAIVKEVEDESGGQAGLGAFHYMFSGFFKLP